MKRMIPIVLGILAVTAGAFAQEPADAIQKALLAAPTRMKKEDVTVIKWKPDFTYDTLQKGAGTLVCYDLSGWPLHPFMLECTSMGNLPRVAQNLKAEASGDRKASEATLAAEEKDGTRIKPEFGSVFIHFMGPDQEHAFHHTTIAVPGATAQSLGLPDKPTPNGVWIMNAGTSTAHLMTPGS
ncbi:MAG: hypothetical protein ABSH31_13425 [Bryobacteraceae bacterium]|jgi:hypothetical protein